VAGASGISGNAIALATFHTNFNLIGILLIFPFSKSFSAWICYLIPDRSAPLSRRLDSVARGERATAIIAARLTIMEVTAALGALLRDMIVAGRETKGHREVLVEIRTAVGELKEFVSKLPSGSQEDGKALLRATNTLHALDHLDRLVEAVTNRHLAILLRPECSDQRNLILGFLTTFLDWTSGRDAEAPAATLERLSKELAEHRRSGRIDLLDLSAAGRASPAETLHVLDATRWLDSLAFGLWRTTEHLDGDGIAKDPRRPSKS
jgi:phosphate:Na+ symporter